MPLEAPTPKQSPSTTDPLKALVWDCAALVLANLSISDLARSQRISKHWQDCIASWGLQQHFPDKWRQAVDADNGDREEIFRMFNQCAIEHELRERWVSGKVVSRNDMDCSHSHYCTVAGDYSAWKHAGSIFWQRLDYQGGGKPLPHQKLDFEAGAWPSRIDALNLNSLGLIWVRVWCPESGGTGYREHLLDLNTGGELWSRKRFVPNGNRHAHDAHAMIHMGPEVIYRYGERKSDVEVFDVRTGAWLYSLPSIVDFAPVSRIKVHRIAGRDIIFAIKDYNIVRLIDPKNGSRLLDIEIAFWLDTEVVISSRPNESAFALISQVDVDDEESKLTKIRKFASDADGNFIDQGVEVIDLTEISRGSNHEAVAIDPFRNFAVAPQCGHGCPYIWTINPSSTEIKIPDDHDETGEIMARIVSLGNKQALGRLFPKGVGCCNQYVLSIKWNRLYVFCIDIGINIMSFEFRNSWTVYNFGFQHLPSRLTGIQDEVGQTF